MVTSFQVRVALSMLTITITISTDFRPLVIIVILFRHALVHSLYEDEKQKLPVQFVPLEASSDPNFKLVTWDDLHHYKHHTQCRVPTNTAAPAGNMGIQWTMSYGSCLSNKPGRVNTVHRVFKTWPYHRCMDMPSKSFWKHWICFTIFNPQGAGLLRATSA